MLNTPGVPVGSPDPANDVEILSPLAANHPAVPVSWPFVMSTVTVWVNKRNWPKGAPPIAVPTVRTVTVVLVEPMSLSLPCSVPLKRTCCCAAAGNRYRGTDHRRAADHLQAVTGDKKLAALLRDVVDLKDASHYGLASLAGNRAKSALRKAAALVEEAQRRVH